MCWSPHGSGTVNQNSTRFLDFARSHGLRVAGSWFKRPQAHRWTWYSNAGGVAKEIDHVLVDDCWRMIQNCKVYPQGRLTAVDGKSFRTNHSITNMRLDWIGPLVVSGVSLCTDGLAR